MKKVMSWIIVLCIIMSVFSLSVSAQEPDVTFEPAYDMPGEKLKVSSNKTTLSLMSETEALPSSFDARDMGWVTPVKNQFGTPLCGAFSVISALESSSIAQGFADITADYSEAHLGWFTHNKSTDPSDPTYGDGCALEAHEENATTPGVNFSAALRALTRWSGVALDSDYPLSKYYDDDFSDKDRYNTDSGVIIKNAEKLTTTEDVKKWIMANGSVVVSYASVGSFYYHGNYYNGSGYEYEANHAVAIIGWDDSYPASNFHYYYDLPPTDGAWLCKNSWGDKTSFFWMSYCEPSLCAFAGYVTQPADTYRENYTYNGSEYTEVAKMPFAASAANVFKTDEHELLSAISVRTVSPNQPLNISIYTNLDSDYSTPVDGTLALEMSTIAKNEGFHTIELPKDIHLDANTHFSVVIEFLTVDGYAVIPVERNSDYAASQLLSYASKPGQSYIYLETKASWRTNTQFGIENVLIQAFTNCNHQPETTLTESTCKESGYSETKCTQCSEILESSVIPKANCADSDWSYTGNNVFSKICPDCGAVSDTKTVVLESLEKSISLYNGDTDRIAFHTDADLTESVVFSTSDSTVVSVDDKGNITANSVGEAVVTLSIPDTDITAECLITVLPRTFTVTWNIYELMIEDTVKETELIVAPSYPTRTGYVFAGWDKEIPDKMPSENLWFTAQWIPATNTPYTVEIHTMNTAGEYETNIEKHKGTTNETAVTVPEINEGFTLNKEKSVLSGSIAPDGSLVLKAYIDRNKYNLKTIVNDTTTEKEYYYGAKTEAPETPFKEGYKFIGWSGSVPETMPANNITLTAQFEKSYICPDCENEILGEDNIKAHITAEARMKATVSIRNNNGSNVIWYGDTLSLTAVTTNMPEDIRICWYVDGVLQGEGETFNLKFNDGTKTVTVKLEDSDSNVLTDAKGNEVSDSETVTVKSGFIYKLISFFKNLFRISRIVEQMLGM